MASLSGLEGWGRSVRAIEPLSLHEDAGRGQVFRPGDYHSHGIKDADLDAMRTILRKAVEDKTVPGVSLLLAHRGEIIFKEAFGDLTVDQKVLMASSSKPITATVLMILADQKKLELDDPIEKYLLEFKGITINRKPPRIPPTVRHLLCNMSCLPGDFLSESLLKRARIGAGKDHNDVKEKGKPGVGVFSRRNHSLAESVRALTEGGLATKSGTEFHYRTMGSNAAARVAEVASKRSFEDLSRHRAVRAAGHERLAIPRRWFTGAQRSPDSSRRRESLHHGRRGHELDA